MGSIRRRWRGRYVGVMGDGAPGNRGVQTVAENKLCSPPACPSRSAKAEDDVNPDLNSQTTNGSSRI